MLLLLVIMLLKLYKEKENGIAAANSRNFFPLIDTDTRFLTQTRNWCQTDKAQKATLFLSLTHMDSIQSSVF